MKREDRKGGIFFKNDIGNLMFRNEGWAFSIMSL